MQTEDEHRKHSLEEEETTLTGRWEQAALLSSPNCAQGTRRVSYGLPTHQHGFQARFVLSSNCPKTHQSPNAKKDRPELPSVVGTVTACSACFQLRSYLMLFIAAKAPFQRAALALSHFAARGVPGSPWLPRTHLETLPNLALFHEILSLGSPQALSCC